MENTMNKLLIPLGLVAMITSAPAFAATRHVMHKHASYHAACMVHGKKVHCPIHAKHITKKTHAAY
jgi:hypothetical protein